MKCISHLVEFLDISLIMNGLLRYVTVQYGGYLVMAHRGMELNRMIGPR